MLDGSSDADGMIQLFLSSLLRIVFMSNEIGICLCGNIEVTCTELPKNVIACHCYDCQKASGGGPSGLNLTADSGSLVERLFILSFQRGPFGKQAFSTMLKTWRLPQMFGVAALVI